MSFVRIRITGSSSEIRPSSTNCIIAAAVNVFVIDASGNDVGIWIYRQRWKDYLLLDVLYEVDRRIRPTSRPFRPSKDWMTPGGCYPRDLGS